jgi:hypothetical protein
MSESKLFTVAGTATNADGTTKARFANDLVARIKILNKAGCTNINLLELPSPMTITTLDQNTSTADILRPYVAYFKNLINACDKSKNLLQMAITH